MDGNATAYTYDAAGQLLSETRGGYAANYTFDGNGNRLTRMVNGLTETYAYDSGDKLLSVTWSGGSKTYGYDAAGRTTSVTTAAGTTNIAYDWESRITSMTGPGLNSTFGYNGLDTRVSKNAQTFLRDGAYVTDPVLRDGQASYTPGISERRGTTTTFQHSGLKNADAQSSVAQTLTATRQSDAYGNVASSTGSWQGPFGYGGGFGYQTESDSGLMLLGHRYMDPSTGRFLTRDPIKDGRNWYGYVGNNPITAADPSGLLSLKSLVKGLIRLITEIGGGPPSGVVGDINQEILDEVLRKGKSRIEREIDLPANEIPGVTIGPVSKPPLFIIPFSDVGEQLGGTGGFIIDIINPIGWMQDVVDFVTLPWTDGFGRSDGVIPFPGIEPHQRPGMVGMTTVTGSKHYN